MKELRVPVINVQDTNNDENHKKLDKAETHSPGTTSCD